VKSKLCLKIHFCKDDTNICVFLRFQILEKWTNLRLPVNVQKLSVSASGGFAPLTPDQGLWTPLEAPPPYLRYTLAHSARHGAVPPKKFQARTATAQEFSRVLLAFKCARGALASRLMSTHIMIASYHCQPHTTLCALFTILLRLRFLADRSG